MTYVHDIMLDEAIQRLFCVNIALHVFDIESFLML
jgi:hypothetical protein